MKLLVTGNITKGFASWVQTQDGLVPEMEDPAQMKIFGER